MTDLLIEPFGAPYMARALVEGLILGALCGAVGVYVLVRRLAFLADAITHTVFPGVVIGFLVSGQSGIVPGALVCAVLAAGLFTLVTSTDRVSDDATLAVLLTSFFALGVVLVSRQRSYTADLTAFLFGHILTIDRSDILVTAAVAVLAVLVLLALGRPLLAGAFDREWARAAGYRITLLDLVGNMLIALVVVAAVQAVGTVLVIAMLVVPAATARLVSDRLPVIVAVAMGLGLLGAWWGLAASYSASIDHGVRLSAGATIVLVLVAGYALALLGRVAHRALARPATATR
ncbi:metal ABC transporter permease [Frankia sp. AgPm24]|uniref:Metal ABC transporter permease n=1 Tax=Frankia umida TaxID=573489 RepID=A0ABT0JU73_9ACTN|nr:MULTISPECIES: metal ABC transporter permease [Frankia]MCK9875100.1 metal ABC transporter permease [Frankia umida]MCK9924993.1 metal ABC transporter permease [Frankia sp. AgPm24]